VITAEVRVDETDIVNVRLGQSAEVSIDAFPRQIFKAVVSESETTPWSLDRVATSQSNGSVRKRKTSRSRSRLLNPPEKTFGPDFPPRRRSPPPQLQGIDDSIQALTVRDPPTWWKTKIRRLRHGPKDKKNEQQGGVRHSRQKIEFVPVETGIAGATDIEVRAACRKRRNCNRQLQSAAHLASGVSVNDRTTPRRRRKRSIVSTVSSKTFRRIPASKWDVPRKEAVSEA